MAEYKLAEKGIPIWKEQLRMAIDEAKEHSGNLVEMKEYLKKNFNIDMKVQNKNLSFLHPEKKKYCRGKKLGHAYTKEEIIRFFEKGPERDMVNLGLPYKDDGFKMPKVKSIGLARIGMGMEGITSKISSDIEKEKIRVERKKERLSRSKEKQAAGSRERER